MTYTIRYAEHGTDRTVATETLDDLEALLRTLQPAARVYAVTREPAARLSGPRALVERVVLGWQEGERCVSD